MSPARPDAEAPLHAAAFERLFADLAGLDLVLVAVSGGPDSTALMHALARWRDAPGRPSIAVATVDHGLRAVSREEAESVGAAARELGLDHHLLTWSPHPARVSQDAARRARYRLLDGCAARMGADCLVTAHTLDDQAETVLMRAAAGSGLSGLGGMRPVVARNGLRHARPFLQVPKARLVATCRAEGWLYIEDPSNADPLYARVRWRGLMPDLEEQGLDAARLSRLARRLRRADEALDAIATAAFGRLGRPLPEGAVALDGRALAAEQDEIALRVLALTLRQGNPAPIRLERLEACFAAISAALSAREALRRTLAGRQITVARDGQIRVAPEPPRRRGRAPVTEIAAAAPHSLGIDDART
jgi:tRNA(Ile)-lysidine synthase